jgi:MFS family permease
MADAPDPEQGGTEEREPELEPAGAAETEPPSSGITLTQYAVLVAAGAFATTFAQSRVLGNYPTTFLLKDHLHLPREQVAFFFLWATFAWNLKPLAGILTDAFPLFGTRRRSYMILGSLAAGILWLVMGFTANAFLPLLIVSVCMNVATVFASTVMGGLMVEAGQAFGAPGRISALRQIVQSIATIVAPTLGGWLAGKAFGWTATTTIAAMTALSLAVLTFFVLRERPVEPPAEHSAPLRKPHYRPPLGIYMGGLAGIAVGLYFYLNPDYRSIGYSVFALVAMMALLIGLIELPTRNPVIVKAQGQLVQIMQSRTLWMASFLLFLTHTVPGLNTALTYRQEDVLKFSKGFIGLMGSVEGVFGVIAAAAYVVYCRKFNLRFLLIAGVAINAAATLLYLIYTRGTAPLVHSLGGFVVVLSELALMDLAVRSTPRGCEALGFSLMMSVRNFGLALSDVLGSMMMDRLGVKFENLVLINAGTTFAILFFIPLLPAALMLRKEGETGAPTPDMANRLEEGAAATPGKT